MERLQTRAAPTQSLASATCIFCGNLDRVETRIWPEWLNIPAPDTLPLVCAACNAGWMAALDRDVARDLAPVLRGETVLLSGAQMKMLAGWLCLLAVKLAAARQACGISMAERAHLRHTGRPSQNWAIFAGGLREAAGVPSCRHHPCRIEFSGNPVAGHSRGRPSAACNSQILSVGIGPLFFHMFFSPSLINLHDFTAASRSHGLTPLWPPRRRLGLLPGRGTRLPPQHTLTHAEADHVTDGFAAHYRPEPGGPYWPEPPDTPPLRARHCAAQQK
jgi:hypothetical protein